MHLTHRLLSIPQEKKRTWVFLVQEVAQVEQVPLDYDQEGHGQKHKDQHVYCEFWKINICFKNKLKKKKIT